MSKPTAFPLDESKLPFEISKDAVLREKIVKLGQMIDHAAVRAFAGVLPAAGRRGRTHSAQGQKGQTACAEWK